MRGPLFGGEGWGGTCNGTRTYQSLSVGQGTVSRRGKSGLYFLALVKRHSQQELVSSLHMVYKDSRFHNPTHGGPRQTLAYPATGTGEPCPVPAYTLVGCVGQVNRSVDRTRMLSRPRERRPWEKTKTGNTAVASLHEVHLRYNEISREK